MDKLTMAHQYAMLHMSNPQYKDVDDLEMVQWAFDYADLMQAEADKRKPKHELPSLQQTFIDGVEQPRYAPPCEEWQPDWSQAPEWANWWAVDKDLLSFWHEDRPKFDEIEFYQFGMFCDAPSFDYQGNWQDSLRKRPQ